MTSHLLPSGDFAITLTPNEAANLFATLTVAYPTLPVDAEGLEVVRNFTAIILAAQFTHKSPMARNRMENN